MIVVRCQQGTEEWLRARVGAITASMFAECRKVVGGLDEKQAAYVELIKSGIDKADAIKQAGYKAEPKAKSIEAAIKSEPVGDFTDAAKKYAFRLAIERISGELLDVDKFEIWQGKRGNLLEPVARSKHEALIGEIIDECGFVLTDDGRFGCSLDGEIGEEGSAEYKCYLDPDKISRIILSKDISDEMDQIQGGLWITGRKWCEFVLYCPALESIGKDITRFKVERDDDYIEALELDLLRFDKLVESYVEKLSEVDNAA
jgi:hypothetical protein